MEYFGKGEGHVKAGPGFETKITRKEDDHLRQEGQDRLLHRKGMGW